MKLDNFTEEEIRSLFYKILCKIETDKSIVQNSLKYNPILKIGGSYCFEYYNGFEHKMCCIQDRKVLVSSESEEDNKYLTNYLKSVVQEIAEQKFSCQV